MKGANMDHVSADRRLRELNADLDNIADAGDGLVTIGTVRRMLDELHACGRADGSDAFSAGFQMAARVEQKHVRAELATFVMAVLGKERGDGVIDLGTLGKWWPQENKAATSADDSDVHERWNAPDGPSIDKA